MTNGFQRGAFKTFADAFGIAREPCKLRTHFQHVIAETVAIAQKQHGFVFELFSCDGLFLAQWMLQRQCGHERLIVQRRCGHARVWKWLGQDGAIYLAGAQHFHQFDCEVFLQHERHLRRFAHRLLHQVGQEIRANGVDHAQAQWAGQWIFAAFGNLFDFGRLLKHLLCVLNDFFTQWRHADFVGIALKQFDVKFFF